MKPEGGKNMNQDFQSDEAEDKAVRRVRLIRLGLRNKDQFTLDGVKADIVREWGERIGSKVFDDLLFLEMLEINREEMKRDGIDLSLFDDD